MTCVDLAACAFYIDDGSHLADGMGPAGSPYTGLRIAFAAGFVPPQQGSFVRVAGIRTVQKVILPEPAVVNGECRDAGSILYVPVVAVRDQNDVVAGN